MLVTITATRPPGAGWPATDLGYLLPIALDPAFPDWGTSWYCDVTLTGVLRLADALSQLYVLLPVLDAWWERMTESGGEGMVVKPHAALVRDGRRIVQPGVKCRGTEYLRIIYGPEYLEPRNLARLRGRFLGRKQSLALREYALGLEALERFVAHEPLYRVHESVFAVLALESEPVDPRL